MSVKHSYTFDIDSGERDPAVYPNPNDYVIDLKNPIYNVTKISLISARIHASQLLVNERNNTFSLSGTSVSLANNNYNGESLAEEIKNKSNGVITTAEYDSDINSITFTGAAPFTFDFYTGENGFNTNRTAYSTPHDIFGLPPLDISSDANHQIITGSINLQGPDALILKLSSGSDEFNKTVFSETPYYTGRILMCGDALNYSGAEDAIVHNFDTGSQKSISSLRVQFFYSSNNRLIPYDFRNANHVLKLAIECSTGKTQSLADHEAKDFSLPPPLRIPELENPNRWNGFVYIFIVIFTGILFMMFTKPRKT